MNCGKFVDVMNFDNEELSNGLLNYLRAPGIPRMLIVNRTAAVLESSIGKEIDLGCAIIVIWYSNCM